MNTFNVVIALVQNNPITWVWDFKNPNWLPENNIVFQVRTTNLIDGFVMVVFNELNHAFEILFYNKNKTRVKAIVGVQITEIITEIHNVILDIPQNTIDIKMCRNSLN